MNREDPEFFSKLAHGQKPRYLWIGCSDSRVPANAIVDKPPGAIFVHRNVANMVVETDLNLLSVVYYAVHVLEIEHIVVCGHYGCGGILAALDTTRPLGFLEGWVGLIRNVYSRNRKYLDSIADPGERERRFTEINVGQQVKNLSRIQVVQDRWRAATLPQIHGFVYDVADGLLHDLKVTRDGSTESDGTAS
jgi:carbonic anhydrase